MCSSFSFFQPKWDVCVSVFWGKDRFEGAKNDQLYQQNIMVK